MTTTESLFDEIERNNIEVYLGSMPAAKSASANIGDDYYIALDEQSLESTAARRLPKNALCWPTKPGTA